MKIHSGKLEVRYTLQLLEKRKFVCLSVCALSVSQLVQPCLKYLFVCLLFCGGVQQCAAQSGHLVIGSMAPATHRIKHPTTNLKGEEKKKRKRNFDCLELEVS